MQTLDSVAGVKRFEFPKESASGWVDNRSRLRVAIVAGTLGQGGAEKQLVYMARALKFIGADVCVYCLSQGEFYQTRLEALGVPHVWFGRSSNRLARMGALAFKLREFRPHIVQAMHFYTNLYVWTAACASGAVGIGCIRGDAIDDVETNGFWGKLLLKFPPRLLANSRVARDNAMRLGVPGERVYVLDNVIDLDEFDREKARGCDGFGEPTNIIVLTVCSLLPYKRVDWFLRSLVLARRTIGNLLGVIVGDGPERHTLEELADDLGLLGNGVVFVGRQDNVPAILSKAHMLVVSSEHEGFPNVILEAMAAGLPVITTDAGDAPIVVRDGVTGMIVPKNDQAGMADRMVELALNPERREKLGAEARVVVEQNYSYPVLGKKIMDAYRGIVATQGHRGFVTLQQLTAPCPHS